MKKKYIIVAVAAAMSVQMKAAEETETTAKETKK